MELLPYSLDGPILAEILAMMQKRISCHTLDVETGDVRLTQHWIPLAAEHFFVAHVRKERYRINEPLLVALACIDEVLNQFFSNQWTLVYSGCRYSIVDDGMKRTYRFVIGLRKQHEKRFEYFALTTVIWLDQKSVQWLGGRVYLRSLQPRKHGRSSAIQQYTYVYVCFKGQACESKVTLLLYEDFTFPSPHSDVR
jgi:hypothetical protein